MVTSVKTPVKIKVDLSTREALKALGRKGESYDDVVRALIDSSESLIVAQEEITKLAVRIQDLEEEG